MRSWTMGAGGERHKAGTAVALLALVAICADGPAQGDAPAALPRLSVTAEMPAQPWLVLPETAPTQLPEGRAGSGLLCAPDTPGLPIDLATAWRLARTSNLDIAVARQIVAQAQAGHDRARVQILPHVNLGSTYVDHEGKIQQAVGNILDTNRNSLFVGGGPSVAVQFNEALFAPLAARQVVAATQAGLDRVTNDTLAAVADTYLAMLRARRRLERVEETLDFLSATTPHPRRGDAKGLRPLVESFIKAGDPAGIKADLARVDVEILRRREEGRTAWQEFQLASAELARLLRLPPDVLLWPVEPIDRPMPLPSADWLDVDPQALVAAALGNRPEVAENEALIQAALRRWQSAKWRPLMPSAVVNFSAGWFGGSPNFLRRDPERGLGIGTAMTDDGRIDQWGGRHDFDVALFWRLSNLGLGNYAEVREHGAWHEQARLRSILAQDRVITQVVQAHALVQSTRERLALTRAALFDDRGEPAGPVFQSLRLNFSRIRNLFDKARALEVMDSIRGLNDILEAHGQAVTDYERAHLRLLWALGMAAGNE